MKHALRMVRSGATTLGAAAIVAGAAAALATDAGLKGLAPDLDALPAAQSAPAATQPPAGHIVVGARWLEEEIGCDAVAAAVERGEAVCLQ